MLSRPGSWRQSRASRRACGAGRRDNRCSGKAIRKDPSQTTDVVTRIRSHSGKLFERIAMHIVATSPDNASEIAYDYLSDETIIDADWCRDEYAAIPQTHGFDCAPTASAPDLDISMLFDGHRRLAVVLETPPDVRPLRMKPATIALVPFATSSGAGATCSRVRRQEIRRRGRRIWRSGCTGKTDIFQEAQSPLTNAAECSFSPSRIRSRSCERGARSLIDDENRSRTTSAREQTRTSVSNDPMAYSLKAAQLRTTAGFPPAVP